MEAERFVLIGTLGGALVGALSGLVATWISKIYEDRMHKRALVINAAMENWKKAIELALAQKREISINPVDDFIIHMMKFSELILEKKITEANVIQKLSEIEKITMEVQKFHEQQNKYRVAVRKRRGHSETAREDEKMGSTPSR